MKLKAAGFWTKVIVVAITTYLACSLMAVVGEIQETQALMDQLETEVNSLDESNQKMSHALENKDDPDLLEQVARERGYYRPGERLFMDVAG